MQTINARNSLEAWRRAAALLLVQGEQNNLIIEIESPAEFDQGWLKRYSPHRSKPQGDILSDVINTVFPWKLADRCASRAELYRRYTACHARSRRMGHNPGAWGTYFERLIGFGPDGPNQLEVAILKLREWKANFRAAFVFHTSGPHLDGPRTRGGPCWHYGQLLGHPDGTLDFLAVYRNHDYYNKAFGNFIALGKLHRFICVQAEKRPGRLICHSAHAYFDSSKAQLEALLAR